MKTPKKWIFFCVFFLQAEDGIRDYDVTGVQTCALPILIQMVVQVQGVKTRPLSHGHLSEDRICLESSGLGLAKAQTRGEISKDKDARSLARFLTYTLQSMFTIARTNPTEAFMTDVVETSLSVLG